MSVKPAIFFLFLFSLLVLVVVQSWPLEANDRRAYQHGVSLIKDQKNRVWAIWSSSPGEPPQGETKIRLPDGTKCAHFTHDIFYTQLHPENPVPDPQLLVQMPEAQEPVNVAINANDVVAITFEDGSESDVNNCDGIISQRYQMFQHFPEQASELKTVQVSGGHSGHIAAVGDDFVIAYSEGWIEGGGFDNAGTANDIYVETVSESGESRWHIAVSKDDGWPRDWWPVVATSSQHALLLWQRMVKDNDYAQLMLAMYDPANNTLIKPATLLKKNLQYYHYNVTYLPSIKRYLIAGNYLGVTTDSRSRTNLSPKLFVMLLDSSGELVYSWEYDKECRECGSYLNFNLVRESNPAVLVFADELVVQYPVKPNGIVSLKVTGQQIEFKEHIKLNSLWFPLGADGIFVDNKSMFVNLTPQGMRVITVP